MSFVHEYVSTAPARSGRVDSTEWNRKHVWNGSLTSGTWAHAPTMFRLRLTGTGTVVVDAKDSLGNITTGVETYAPSGATDQIEYPYLGEDAISIRVTLTGTATAEVI